MRWLSRLRLELPDDDAAMLDVEIDQAFEEMDARELVRAADRVGQQVPAARALLRAAQLELDAGDVEEARELLERSRELPLAPAYASRRTEVGQRLRLAEEGPLNAADLPTFEDALARKQPSTRGAKGTLGVLLPLSGSFARFGEESLEGVLLAAGIFGADGAGSELRVVIRDTAGRPERAAEAVRELAEEQGVSAIVGPLLSGPCEAAGAVAQELGIPLLTLSSREEIARERDYVFRLRTMPSEEVQILVDHAIRVMGARTFAILYPRDAYGRGLRRLFWDTVEDQGGSVVGVASYDPEANDFGDPVRQLVGYTLLTNAEKDLVKEREEMLRRARRLPLEEAILAREEAEAMLGPDEQPLPPIVDFDVLFVPESHEKVGLIAPSLAFHGALGMHLLGPNGWHHPDLIAVGQEHVEGAVLTSHFFAESGLPFVQSFATRYGRAFQQPPDLFAAQAYDAANLALVQMARGRVEPEALRDGLLATQTYPGVTGVLSMRADGNARKRPFLLAVERGKFVEVSE